MLKKILRRLNRDHRPVQDRTFHVSRGDAYNSEGKWPLAIHHYEQALAIDPKLPAIWVQLGHSYRETKDYAAAEKAYRQALEIERSNADAWFFLGVTLFLTEKNGDAFNAMLRAVELDPAGPAARDLATRCGVRANDFGDFVQALDEFFDPEYYLKVNEDLRSAGIDPKQHYLSFGWREDRSFSSWFDPVYYRRRHRKLVGAHTPPLQHYWKTGRSLDLRCSAANGKNWFQAIAPEKAAWTSVTPARLAPETRAVVILPVYKGFDETLASIFHALSHRGNSAYSLLVINDCGPDAELNAELDRLSEKGLFDYLVNDTNRGFVQTCNRGILEFSGDKDVVLLNSDAFVPPGWFDRLVRHAESDASIATVTPLSNNATICSYPKTDSDNFHALELSPLEMDALAAETNPGLHVETPTGVGFCFFMSRRAIDDIGALDPIAFKLGYGEENDFCMRALEAGYKNVIAADVFVFHVGSVSFSVTKDANYAAGQLALDLKHPNYALLTRRHVLADPMRYGRMKLDAARLVRALDRPVVFITHAWGGGIDTYLDSKRKELDRQGISHITITVKDGSFVSIETSDDPYVFTPNLADVDLRLDFKFFCDLLTSLKPSLLHINSFAGLDWVHHAALLQFITNAGIRYRYIGHDYSSISRFYHLTRPDNIYRGLPDWRDLEDWARMTELGPRDVCSNDDRRKAYSDFLSNAECVEFPSQAARTVLETFYSDFQAEVIPHEQPFDTSVTAARRPADGKLRIASIGAIGSHKGSDVLLALARDAKARDLGIEYSIIGYSDQDKAMEAAGVEVTGLYSSEEEAIQHLQRIQPDLVFIASVWPETYCYTLSIPLALKMPFAVFDLGAQAERAAAVTWGVKFDPALINASSLLSEKIKKIDFESLWSAVSQST